MSGRRMGDLGLRDLDRTPFYPTHARVSPAVVSSPQQLDTMSNFAVQSRSPSGQDLQQSAAFENEFAAVNFNPATRPYQSPVSYTGLHVPKRSRSPGKEAAPPFQYRASPRLEGYHLASPGPVSSTRLLSTPTFSQGAAPSSQNARQLNASHNSSPAPCIASPFRPSSKTRVAPPRPPRSPGIYEFDSFLPPHFRSTSAPLIVPYGQGPYIESSEGSPDSNIAQASTARELKFNAAKSSRTPQLVPPHEPGGYNPLLNPYTPRPKFSSPKSSSSKSTKKTNIFARAFRKFSDRKVSSHHSPRASKSRSPSPSAPFSRPRAPTPYHWRAFTQPQVRYHGQHFSKTLGYQSSEDILSANKTTEIKTFFSVNANGTVVLNADPAANRWEGETLRESQIWNNRSFTCPSVVFEELREDRTPPNQYQSDFQEFAGTPASQSDSPRESLDSLRTLVPRPEGLGIYQDSVRPFSWQIQNPRTSRDSADTLVATPEYLSVHRNFEGQFFSSIPRRRREPQAIASGEGAGHWADNHITALEKSRSSPIPSIFFEQIGNPAYDQAAPAQNPEFNQQQGFRHLPGEIDLSLSYRESVVAARSPQNPVHRKIPAFSHETLGPDTPRGEGCRQAYWALTGSRPTDSICHFWGNRSQDLIHEKVAEEQCTLKSEENFDGRYSRAPLEHFEELSPNRGLGLVCESESIPDEGIATEPTCSIAKRKYFAERKRLARIREGDRVAASSDREGPGEGIIDKFLAERREIEVETAPIGRPQTFSAPKRALERQERLATIPDEAQASSPSPNRYFNKDFEPNPPLGQEVVETNCRVEGRSDCGGEKGHGDLVASSDSASHIPKGAVKRWTNRPRKYSALFREEEFLVCTRSKTGTVKELPITPENKDKIKTVLQQAAVYTPSVYSGDYQQSPPSTVPELSVTPLAFKKKCPTAPSSGQFFDKFPFPGQSDPFRTTRALLDSCLSESVEHSQHQMDTLQVSSALRSSTKTKAEEDAQVMQKSVLESCKKAGRDPPKYVLLELIGKGSFGRVYKGKDINTTQIVAVKIIDIDESDTLNPRLADTYSEFMKEVNALKILSESRAKNINHVIEALPVGTAMWMITEYCGGGSIATLMKPTPGGLKEKFIIPIIREVAEAVKWVHQAGIIHRDLKCANILITEEGGVQLCDFGVAGITETALDKRSTFIGTFHWMAPELFRGSQYGKEVDIWAFGSMTYEMATGLPPNAMSGVSGMDLGAYLQTHIPRLEGDSYSEGLKSIVAFCLEENPGDRPTIEAVQRHGYIHNTNAKHPSSGLSDLVKAFKLWESHGGTRKSLFAVGGAQGPSELSSTALSDDSWNFSTTPAFDQAVAQAADPQDIINVYGASVALSTDFVDDETSRPIRQQQARPNRRRPPPEALAPLKAPLEKIFDPNTISNYKENSITHFNLQPNNASDLPLRDDSAQTSIRDTLIDLDAHDVPSGLSSFSEMDTMKPARRAVQDEYEDQYESGHDFTRSALSDPVDNPNRRTQDWKFPSMAPPASANLEHTRFPALQRPNMTPASGARPALIHHPTEPISLPTQTSHSLVPPAPGSDRMSLIDLDMSIPEPSRPSTADSAASQDNASANPFMWERHASVYNAHGHQSAREPSLYLDDSSGLPMRAGNTFQDLSEVSDFSASDAEGYQDDHYNGYRSRHEEQDDRRFEHSAAGHIQGDYGNRSPWNGLNSSSTSHSAALFHPLPPPPSAAILSGTASHAEMHAESGRMFNTLRSSLETFREAYEHMPTRPPKNNQNTTGDDAHVASSMHDNGPNMS